MQNTATGTRGGNVMRGASGEDYVDGRGGRDRLVTGGGADMLAASDGTRDRAVSCGPGVDFAIVDRRDRPVERGPDRCERVDDGRRKRPRAGSEVYVDPDACRQPLAAQLPAADRLVPLADSVILPTGSAPAARTELDATTCAVALTAAGTRPGAVATADVSGDRFDVAVARQSVPSVDLSIAPPVCGAGAPAASAAQRGLRVRRRRGKSRWQVLAGYSNGASYSTDWTTIEECDRTITIVHEGHVDVFDKTRGVTVRLAAGERYEALAPGAAARKPNGGAR